MTDVPIRVDRVSKRFDKTVALDDVSLEIHRGEIFGLLGPNGAGKTTLIRTILDIIKPDSGRVEIFGRPFRPGGSRSTRIPARGTRPLSARTGRGGAASISDA